MTFTNHKSVLFSWCFFSLMLLCASSRRVVEPVVISINAMPGLQFDIVRFKVKPGAAIKLVFTNQDDMSHNLVITRPGTRKAIVEAAMELGDKGEQQNFIPKSSNVLWAIPVLPPGESRTIDFVAPNEEGVYPYVCTYPGHGFIMYGAMYVTNGELPPIAQDENIEPGRRTEQKSTAITPVIDHNHAHAISGVEATKAGHPYTPVAPYLYRVFMDDTGPAAIAVNLPHQLSYCWDAGSCRLRYAWTGEFLDLAEFWKGHKDAQAKVAGKIFYRDKSPFPIRVGHFEKIPAPKFKGYRLIEKYPEFHYELDGVSIYESLYPKEDGRGLIRKFRVAKSGKPVWFTFDPEDGVTYTTKNGPIKNNRIKLPAGGEISITMTRRNGDARSYEIQSIPMPPGLMSETGAIDFLPDGRLVACFLRGEVMIYTPKTQKWQLFAEGLHEPLGISVISNSEFLVMQRPELTRIKDTDGDGHADLYETVTDDFGISGNYHEYNYGPVKDRNGNLFVALNSASARGQVMKEVRGKRDTTAKDISRQMFSPVSYRGWIMQLTPEGKLIPYASGFRSPNGIGFDLKGNFFATDNQGDWVGTTPLYHVQKGKFYGHPGALVWQDNWNQGDPYKLAPEVLDKMRTRAAVLFPHNIMANSITQPVCDATAGKFGPFAGQLFVGEMNQGRIVRVMMEEVGGQLQGACVPFFDGNGLRKGNNRLAFAPDGSLWVGQAEHSWAGDTGIQRISFTGTTPMEVYSMSLTSTGFDLTFTRPVDPAEASNPDLYKFRNYYYEYHRAYGSDQFDAKPIGVKEVKISADGKKAHISLDRLQEGYVYELTLGPLKAADGKPLENRIICYTLNKLR